MSGNVNTFKPDFSDVIRAIVDSMLLDLNVCMPAKVVKYDSEKQYADVQIQLYQKINETLVTYPVIPGVPVIHPRANGGATFIHLPIQAGDDVLLVFSQRSLDSWKTAGGLSDPNDPRKHHITDAFAIPGGSSMADAFKVLDPTAIEITNEDSTIQVFDNGTFKVKNPDNELFDLLVQITGKLQTFLDTIKVDTTNTIFGPQKLNAFLTYTQLATDVADLKTKLTTLKG